MTTLSFNQNLDGAYVAISNGIAIGGIWRASWNENGREVSGWLASKWADGVRGRARRYLTSEMAMRGIREAVK